MTTKAQEREALKNIRTIIEALGKNSYLAITFDGILEQKLGVALTPGVGVP